MKNFNPVTVNRGDSDRPLISWEPTIEEETNSGVREVCLKTRHLSTGKIFLTGPVTEEMSNNFVSEMLYLAEKKEPVDIYINSPGGEVNAGLVIYDTIQACLNKMEINMYCIGSAASMAAVILSGGPKGHRFILPHSQVMIHEPLISGGLGGSATSIQKTSESILDVKRIIVEILSNHTGKTKKAIETAISFDNYMKASEAVKFGICDEVRNIFTPDCPYSAL